MVTLTCFGYRCVHNLRHIIADFSYRNTISFQGWCLSYLEQLGDVPCTMQMCISLCTAIRGQMTHLDPLLPKPESHPFVNIANQRAFSTSLLYLNLALSSKSDDPKGFYHPVQRDVRESFVDISQAHQTSLLSHHLSSPCHPQSLNP